MNKTVISYFFCVTVLVHNTSIFSFFVFCRHLFSINPPPSIHRQFTVNSPPIHHQFTTNSLPIARQLTTNLPIIHHQLILPEIVEVKILNYSLKMKLLLSQFILNGLKTLKVGAHFFILQA